MPLRQLFPSPPGNSKPQEKVDIFAVHGLNPLSKKPAGHALDTWRKPQNETGHLWLKDDLPTACPDARIFFYEYDSTVVYGSDQGTFIDKASEFLEAIRVERDDEDRPIIFLGHSLGGLLIEQALLNAHDNKKYATIKDATSGIAFFGTPHDGGNATFLTVGGVAATIARAVGFQKGDNVLKALQEGSMFTAILQERWRHRLLEWGIVSFWGSHDNMVSYKSSCFFLPGEKEHIVKLNTNHSGLCCFDNSQEDRDIYKIVEKSMKDLYIAALAKSKLKDALSFNEQDSDKQVVAEGEPQEKQGSLESRFMELGRGSRAAPTIF